MLKKKPIKQSKALCPRLQAWFSAADYCREKTLTRFYESIKDEENVSPNSKEREEEEEENGIPDDEAIEF